MGVKLAWISWDELHHGLCLYSYDTHRNASKLCSASNHCFRPSFKCLHKAIFVKHTTKPFPLAVINTTDGCTRIACVLRDVCNRSVWRVQRFCNRKRSTNVGRHIAEPPQYIRNTFKVI
uniref:ACC1 n=1 Tax=Arundo donax TaxID=35708 RepID=A0A0A9DIU8_ARUDO